MDISAIESDGKWWAEPIASSIDDSFVMDALTFWMFFLVATELKRNAPSCG
jgi:hypothetical protein